jgi:hypothetical protein
METAEADAADDTNFLRENLCLVFISVSLPEITATMAQMIAQAGAKFAPEYFFSQYLSLGTFYP